METDASKLIILVIGAVLAIPILLYGVDIVLPPEDASPAAQEDEQLPAVDTAVTAQSLAYLTHRSDVGKVVIQGTQVFIGFSTRPKDMDLAAIVSEAALKYADATGRKVYVHGTHVEQLASIGTPDYREYCRDHAGVSSVLGDDGKAVTKPVLLESTC